jgi:hypothetical protein
MVSPLDNSKRSANSERGAFLFAYGWAGVARRRGGSDRADRDA